MDKLLEHSVFNRYAAAKHRRFIERHLRYSDELRGDILEVLFKHLPVQEDMKLRHQRIDDITDDLIKVMNGDYLNDSEL